MCTCTRASVTDISRGSSRGKSRVSEKSADKSARILVRVRLGQTDSTTAADCQLWQAEWTTRRHSRDDPREDVGVSVRVGVVECQLKASYTSH